VAQTQNRGLTRPAPSGEAGIRGGAEALQGFLGIEMRQMDETHYLGDR